MSPLLPAHLQILNFNIVSLPRQTLVFTRLDSDHRYALAVGRFYNPVALQNNWFGMALNVARPQ